MQPGPNDVIRIELTLFIFPGSLIRLTRDCSPALMRKTCEYITEHDRPIKVCFTTCKTSGCNVNGATSLVLLRDGTTSGVVVTLVALSIGAVMIKDVLQFGVD